MEKIIIPKLGKYSTRIENEFSKTTELGIKDEFYDPFKSVFFKDDVFFNCKLANKNNSNSTYICKTYCSSFNNMGGKEKKECYKSECFKQIKDGHDISESKEEYNNTDGVHKSAYQRELDGKKERFIIICLVLYNDIISTTFFYRFSLYFPVCNYYKTP